MTVKTDPIYSREQPSQDFALIKQNSETTDKNLKQKVIRYACGLCTEAVKPLCFMNSSCACLRFRCPLENNCQWVLSSWVMELFVHVIFFLHIIWKIYILQKKKSSY